MPETLPRPPSLRAEIRKTFRYTVWCGFCTVEWDAERDLHMQEPTKSTFAVCLAKEGWRYVEIAAGEGFACPSCLRHFRDRKQRHDEKLVFPYGDTPEALRETAEAEDE
jgi:hypothetical protein